MQVFNQRWALTNFLFSITLALSALGSSGSAQVIIEPQIVVEPAQSSGLTVEAIFKQRKFSPDSFVPNWESEGGKFIRPKKSATQNNAFDLVAIDPANGSETVLFSADKLIPAGTNKPLAIKDHQWADNRNLALIYTNTRKVWRHHSRGDYWLLNRTNGSLRQVGKDKPEATLMFAKFSPDAKRIAYVCQGNVYIENVESGETKKITEKSSPEIINGTSDWVYEEEFDLKDCIRWSPDSKKIAFWEFDTSKVGEFTLINNTDSLYPKLKTFKHTKPGETNSAVRMGVIHLEDGSTKWLDVPGDNRDNYLPRARWTGDNELMLQRLNRAQNRNSVLLADATTGTTKELFYDEDKAWVDTCDTIVEVNDGKQFTWISEKDGWRHVYLVDQTTGEMNLITPGNYDVMTLLRVTEDSIYFIGSPEKPTDRYLYRVPLTGGAAERLTPERYVGWNDYNISADGKFAVHTVSGFGSPPVVQMVKLPTHESVRVLYNNERIRSELGKLPKTQTEFIKVNVEGVALDSWIMKPINFDPSKQYPVIVHVYGEPWGTTVTNRWDSRNYLWHRLMCEKGYAVCSIDNRGTKVPRGRDFRKSVYKQIGILAAADQAGAVKAITNHYTWMDKSRIGVWGWSGGGSMTLNAMFKYPDLYHTGVSIAAVPDQRYYDSIYQERYNGTPQNNPAGYRDGSPIHYAKNLKGNLLIIHGTGDDNCHYQTVELLINELIKQDKQFAMMAYPNRSHSINEGENTSVHLRKLMTNYFLKNLPAGGK